MSNRHNRGPPKPQEPVAFQLRTARDLQRRDVITAHGPRTYLKPAELDSSELPDDYRNWLLVTLGDNEEVHRYCWAAIRPPRKVQWEIDAQARSDGFFAPHHYVPSILEPAKFYQRKTGDDWAQGKPAGDAFGPRLNFLVVITQRQMVVPVKGYRLTTTLGELVSQTRSTSTNSTVIERIELQLGPPEDLLLTVEEQNLLGSAIMQIYEERLMAKGEDLPVQEVRDQSAKVARLRHLSAMAVHYGLKIYLATTHSLLDTIPVEEVESLSFAEVKHKLAERHPTKCSARTQLLYKCSILRDEEYIGEYPEILEEGILCLESPARAPTRTEGLMLHHALADRDKESVLQMLREGIHPGPLISSDDGSTHNLLQAALVGDFTHEGQTSNSSLCPQLTELLIEARAEVDRIDDSGITPLILATTMEYTAGIELLLRHRANPNLTDQLYEESPLHYAIQHNSEACVQLLLNGRANPLLSSDTSEQVTGLAMEHAPDLPLAQRVTALSRCISSLADLRGELQAELRNLQEQRLLYPEIQETLTTASQALLSAMTSLNDRVEDMSAVVERQQIQLIGASQRILPSPTLSIRNLQQHDQRLARQEHQKSQEHRDHQPSRGVPPDVKSDIQSSASATTNSLALVLAPAPCAKARTNPPCSLALANQSPCEGPENSRPGTSIFKRSLLFIARAESAPGRS
eukprot:s723_g14.t1